MKTTTHAVTEERLRRDIGWLTGEMDRAKEKGKEPSHEVVKAIAHLTRLLDRMTGSPKAVNFKAVLHVPVMPDTAHSVIAEFQAKALERLRGELWRHYDAAQAAGLEYLADRLGQACRVVLLLREDAERWREVSPHIGWRCRAVYRTVTVIVDDEAAANSFPRDDDDEVVREWRKAIHVLRQEMKADQSKSCVDAIGIVTIIANDLRSGKITGITGCRDSALAYIDYALRGI